MDRLKDCRIYKRDRFRIKPIIYTQISQQILINVARRKNSENSPPKKNKYRNQDSGPT